MYLLPSEVVDKFLRLIEATNANTKIEYCDRLDFAANRYNLLRTEVSISLFPLVSRTGDRGDLRELSIQKIKISVLFFSVFDQIYLIKFHNFGA